MHNRANMQWGVSDNPNTWGEAQAAILMDLRLVLQEIKGILIPMRDIVTCPNTTNIPNILRGIRDNTRPKPKPRKRKVAAKRRAR